MDIRELKMDEVEFILEFEEEHIPVRGNVCASGDDEFDKQEEDKIIERLENGDYFAWCCVHMIARWEGFEGHDYLGGYTYKDEDDFKQEGGYYEDMKVQALSDLNQRIHDMAMRILKLEEIAK